MMKPILLIAAAVGLSAQTSNFQPPGLSGTPGSGRGEPNVQSGPTAGRPFWGTEVRHTTQILADGTHVDHSSTNQIYRDAQGRIRSEKTNRAQIDDPVAGYSYDLDPVNKIYDKTARQEVYQRGGGNDNSHKPDARTEDLQPKMVNGLLCRGSRITTIIPAGTFGNDHDVKVVNERWYSDDLKTLVKSSNSDPRFGTSTYELTNIVQGPPDPSLFRVPADFASTKDQEHIDAAIRAAQSARSPEMLEREAANFEAEYHYDSAQKLLDAALALRGQVNGDQSADYGLCLLKLGALERKTGHIKEAEAHYANAVRLLPGRPETAPVFLYLGTASLGKKDYAKVTENLERAQSMDVSLAGPVQMWTGLMHERENQPEMAEAAYKAALAAESSDTYRTFETLTLYARFLAEHGRESEAEAMKARMRTTRPHGLVTPKDESNRSGVYKGGGGVAYPSVIYKMDPPYSEEARVAKYSATVLLQIVVGTDGAAHNITVVKAAGFGLDDCAVSTVAKWQFKPGQKDGNPVPVNATVEVNFRLL